VPAPNVYVSGYQPIPMQPWTDIDRGSHNLAISLEARLSQLTSLERQTVLAHLVVADTASSSSLSFPPHGISSNSMPRPDQSPDVEVILDTIPALSLTETRALAAYINRTYDVDQSTPAGTAWGEKFSSVSPTIRGVTFDQVDWFCSVLGILMFSTRSIPTSFTGPSPALQKRHLG
jgi:hypothetical protein